MAQTLLGRGAPVRVLVRDAARGEPWLARGAEVAVAALEDEAGLARALDGARGFFALLPDEPPAADFRAHRLRMADAIARAVRRAGVPHVVLLSAIPASLAEGNGPPAQLHHLERSLRETGAKLTALRACSFQDNVRMALGPARAAGIYPTLLPADVPGPMVATQDVARVAATSLLEPPAGHEVIDVVGPQYSARDVAAALGQALGRTLRVVEIPPQAHVAALLEAGLPGELAEAVAELYACLAAGRVRPCGDRMVAGPTRLEEILPALVAEPAS